MPIKTDVIRVDADHPDPVAITRAADLLQRGELVAFPTETVYGLGTAALDAAAVHRIFEAKGRPANNPIIVHVADAAAARSLVADWPPIADRLIERFWPGPLTLVFNKSPAVPDIVTAGGPTVAIRCPAHPVARALLRAADIPIAAPRANRSTRVSPTTAAHVLSALDGRVRLILDGGQCDRGIESTVLNIACDPPVLLRLGPLTHAELEAVVGRVTIAPHAHAAAGALPSPGRMERHYAPRASLEVINAGQFAARALQLRATGAIVGHIRLDTPDASSRAIPDAFTITLPADADGYATGLYTALHRLDDLRATHILVDTLPATEAWLAIRDRLRRAAHH